MLLVALVLAVGGGPGFARFNFVDHRPLLRQLDERGQPTRPTYRESRENPNNVNYIQPVDQNPSTWLDLPCKQPFVDKGLSASRIFCG